MRSVSEVFACLSTGVIDCGVASVASENASHSLSNAVLESNPIALNWNDDDEDGGGGGDGGGVGDCGIFVPTSKRLSKFDSSKLGMARFA